MGSAFIEAPEPGIWILDCFMPEEGVTFMEVACWCGRTSCHLIESDPVQCPGCGRLGDGMKMKQIANKVGFAHIASPLKLLGRDGKSVVIEGRTRSHTTPEDGIWVVLIMADGTKMRLEPLAVVVNLATHLVEYSPRYWAEEHHTPANWAWLKANPNWGVPEKIAANL